MGDTFFSYLAYSLVSSSHDTFVKEFAGFRREGGLSKNQPPSIIRALPKRCATTAFFPDFLTIVYFGAQDLLPMKVICGEKKSAGGEKVSGPRYVRIQREF